VCRNGGLRGSGLCPVGPRVRQQYHLRRALGGPRGADTTCAELARAAGLGGYWMSWTSDPGTSPFKRFEKSVLPYRLLDGTQISPSWDRLTMDPPPPSESYIDSVIDTNEAGHPRDPTDVGGDAKPREAHPTPLVSVRCAPLCR